MESTLHPGNTGGGNWSDTRVLRRPLNGRLLAGVAAAFAEYLDIDVVIVRIALVALVLVGAAGVPIYLAGWLLIPGEGSETAWVTRKGRWLSASEPDLRVSDAERSHVGELLNQHFAEGRLDATEFDERLNKSMKAKTRSELDGLLHDLPLLRPSRPAEHNSRWRSVLGWAALSSVILAALAWAAWVPHVPLLLLALAAGFLVYRGRRRRMATGKGGELS